MSDIVFIYPPLRRSEVYGPFEKAENILPPLGIASCAAVVRGSGKRVAIIDAVAEHLSLDASVQRACEMRPRFVGITAATVAIENASLLASGIKQKVPGVTIILGGPHVTAVPEKTLRLFSGFDIAVIGEGERTLEELLNAIEGAKDLTGVTGIAFRRDGTVIRNPPRAFIENLDSLPIPAYDLLPDLPRFYRPSAHNFKRLPSISMITSRGCPGRCIFCDLKTFGHKCRRNSIPYTMNMLDYLIGEFGIRDFRLPDDTFVIDRKHVMDFCDELARKKIRITWSCQARVNCVDSDLLNAMRRAGCWQIDYGIESGSQAILNTLKKGITREMAMNALRLTREAGIQAKGYFIIGSPGETLATIQETIRFAKEAPLDSFQVSFFTPFPGSPVYKEIANHGVLEEDWGKMSIWNPVFVPHGMTKDALVQASREALRSFYLRPGVIARYLFRIRSFRGLADIIRSGLIVLRYILRGGNRSMRQHAPSIPFF
jgi:anaerobic magnesium-protoporphyrin IX monomethyl ester cyclase